MLDTNLLKGYLEQLPKSVVEQMLALYVEQAQQYLLDIKTAAEQENQELWRQHCHKMKGAASSVGMTELQRQLAQAEHETNTELFGGKIAIFEQLNSEGIAQFETWLSDN